MSLPRKTFSDRLARLDFSMKVPVGFVESQPPVDPHDFDQPHMCAPLLILASPVALAVITVAARPAYADGTVREWFEFLCREHGIRLLSIGPAYVGGFRKNHPAIIGTGLSMQDETELVMSFVTLEDGARLLTAHAMVPRELEPTFMATLEQCIHSIELVHHQGCTAKLDDNGATWTTEVIAHEEPAPIDEAEVFARKQRKLRARALERARPLVQCDRFDEAAACVLGADDSGESRAALSALFEDELRAQVTMDGRRVPATPRALELYRRALRYRLSTYPDPHTQEEADRYSTGMDTDRSEVAAILGYQPE